MICHYFEEPSYLFFAADIPPLLYYSHIPVSVLALLIGLLVLVNNPKKLQNQLLMAISVCFSAWTFINLIAWTNIHSEVLMFIWPFFGVLAALIYILCIYFMYAFLREDKPIPNTVKLLFIALLIPVFLFAHTDLSVSGFNISDCDAFGFEGQLYNAYYTGLGVLAILWILPLSFVHYKHATALKRRQILYMTIGIELFLLFFASFVYIASFLANIGLFDSSEMEMYGLFGMVIFMAFIGTMIVRFKTFNIGASTSSALVIALIILTGSQFMYVDSRTGIGITAVTLLITGLLAVLLLRSVRKEIKQRKEIESLAQDLEKANVQLQKLDKQKSEFVSIASHQLRSPLTSIRGYASMLLEGNFGTISEKARQPIERIETSAKHMARAVEDYLNVSRIEAGTMKYDLNDFNLKDEIEKICEDVRPTALKKGLVLLFRTDVSSRSIVHADMGKTVQIAHNLINNAIKYTPRGSITIFVRDDTKTKKIYVDIIDTGIGMSSETQQTLFRKFTRAAEANKVDTSGTGLGLFVALQMAEHMGGSIKCSSQGEGKGSRFTLELPLVM